MLQMEYESIIELLHHLYCKKNLVNILANADLTKLLPILLKDQKRQKLFSCIIKSKYNEAIQVRLTSGVKEQQKTLNEIIQKVFEICTKDAQYDQFLKNFLLNDILDSSIKTVKAILENAPKTVLDYFSTEEKTLLQMNPYLFNFLIKMYFTYGEDYILE